MRKISRALSASFFAMLAIRTAFAAGGWANDFEQVVAHRINQEGAVQSTQCEENKNKCSKITTLPPDGYGNILQTIDANSGKEGQWECSMGKGDDIRVCTIFYQNLDGYLERADRLLPNGRYVTIVVGNDHDINRALGWPE